MSRIDPRISRRGNVRLSTRKTTGTATTQEKPSPRTLGHMNRPTMYPRIGIAISGRGEDTASLIGRADKALYGAKQAGKDQVQLDTRDPDRPDGH